MPRAARRLEPAPPLSPLLRSKAAPCQEMPEVVRPHQHPCRLYVPRVQDKDANMHFLHLDSLDALEASQLLRQPCLLSSLPLSSLACRRASGRPCALPAAPSCVSAAHLPSIAATVCAWNLFAFHAVLGEPGIQTRQTSAPRCSLPVQLPPCPVCSHLHRQCRRLASASHGPRTSTAASGATCCRCRAAPRAAHLLWPTCLPAISLKPAMRAPCLGGPRLLTPCLLHPSPPPLPGGRTARAGSHAGPGL